MGLCISQSLSLAVAMAEPITTVLLSPLVVDVYSNAELTLSCNKQYLLFVEFVFVVITICSFLALSLCMRSLIHLLPKAYSDTEKKLKSAFIITSILNLVMTFAFLSGISRDETSVEMDNESCQYWAMKQMASSIGLMALIPQVALCITILLFSTFFCINRQKSVIPANEDPSDPSMAKDIVLPLLSTLLFQVFYFILRLSMSRCTCGWFTLVSRRMEKTLKLCWIKSILVITLQVLYAFYLRRRQSSRLL